LEIQTYFFPLLLVVRGTIPLTDLHASRDSPDLNVPYQTETHLDRQAAPQLTLPNQTLTAMPDLNGPRRA
jgi:hypothetical protein